MKKIETIWHHILYQALKKKEFKHTQQDLAGIFDYSISTVNHSLKIPSQIGAVRKESKFFVLANFEKLLYYWASMRQLERDIIYKTKYQGDVLEIEGLLPQEAIYACYSAGRQIFKEPPADYDKVYFYLPQECLAEIKDRFPSTKTKKEIANIYVFKMPEAMQQYGSVTSLPQTFVDIWNLKDWFAQDFLKKIEEKINAILSQFSN